MEKKVNLKYFGNSKYVGWPTQLAEILKSKQSNTNKKIHVLDEPIFLHHNSNDVAKIEKSYSYLIAFPEKHNFLEFIKTYFKCKSANEAERLLNSLGIVFLDDPFTEGKAYGKEHLLRACLLYLNFSSDNDSTPIFLDIILDDLFPFQPRSNLLAFLRDSFSAQYSLGQQVSILRWLQPILKKNHLLDRKAKFPVFRKSLSVSEKLVWVSKWLDVLAKAKNPSVSPFSFFHLHVNRRPKSGIVFADVQLTVQPPNCQAIELAFKLDTQSTYILGHLIQFDLSMPPDFSPNHVTKMPLDLLQQQSDNLNLLQTKDGEPFNDAFNRVKANINSAIFKAIKKQRRSVAIKHQSELKEFLSADSESAWINCLTRPIAQNLDLVFQKRKDKTKRSKV